LNSFGQISTNSPQFSGMAMPVACTFDRLAVTTFGVSGVADSFTVNLVVNGNDQALTCSVGSTTGSTATCTDNLHTVTVAVGDLVAFKIVQASGAPIVRVGMGTRCN
jgi:hypothetical protein